MTDKFEERKAKIRQQFNAAAADYDTGPGCFGYFGRRLVETTDIQPGQSVLDVATGRGAVLFPAAERVGPTGNVFGIDLAEEMAHATNEETERRGFAARVRIMDAENLDFPDASFDRVLCGFGVMFFPNQDRALSEFRRVLKVSGRLGISTWQVHQNSEIAAVLAEVGISRSRQPGWITEPGDLSRLLTDVGFQNVHVDRDTHSFRYSGSEECWQQARGTGMRQVLDGLDDVQRSRVQNALADRLQRKQKPDGVYSAATALLAVASR